MPWKCSGCGTENPDDAAYCVTCGLKKPEGQIATETSQVTQEQAPEVQQSQGNQEPVLQTQEEQKPETSAVQEEQPQAPEEANVAQQVAESKPVTETQPAEQSTQPVAQPGPAQQTVEQKVTFKYYIQFIATPVSALNKTKVPLDFEVFESISLGRSPENVIMIPDGEISRRHAILYKEGDSLYIEDLNSTNGTYIYDGKIFQTVKGKAPLPGNAVVKLGNNTIIKIVRE
ncbi:FHA domain-containing protein [Metallosphaera tengchongensis]|uniref:FHA domain-containing protein n=1 Tax=Metallosphaera tengchongensis TaxID=1532350 RepID=A0A6N0NVQ5_9CREN|nr:FHA domain-containing protein [Metallosphaera tengchongensis]QKR00926.1 FHA domain-containing protein [Metallosphaera tengchongensis]